MPGVCTSRQRPAPSGLLAKLRNAGRPSTATSQARWRRSAGSLAKALGHPCRGYKQPRNLSALTELVTELQPAAPRLEFASHDRLCLTSHDALDAIIAALAARAAALG